MAKGQTRKESRRFGWASLLAVGTIVVGAGFALGIVAGIGWEEPGLVLGHLKGETEGVAWGPERLAPASPEAVADVGAQQPAVGAPPPLGRPTIPAPKQPEPAKRVEPPAPQAAAPTSRVRPASVDGFAVQVGAFSAQAAANALADSLRANGYEVYVSHRDSAVASWKVRVGPMPTREQAERAADRLRRSQKLDTWILSEAP